MRVLETIETGELSYMAADQIKLWLADGVDVTDLKPMLDALELRLRNFKRKENFVVIGVLSTQIDAVPATLAAIQPWSDLFVKTEADWPSSGIEFRLRGRCCAWICGALERHMPSGSCCGNQIIAEAIDSQKIATAGNVEN